MAISPGPIVLYAAIVGCPSYINTRYPTFMSPSIRVVIPFWEGHAYIEACVASIASSHHKVNEVIIVDNSPTPLRLSQHLLGLVPLKVIRCRPSIGFGRACNVGLRYATTQGTDITILLNQDARLDTCTVSHLTNFLVAHPSCFAAAPLSFEYNGEGISAAFTKMYLAPNTDLIRDLVLGKLKESYIVSNKGVNASCLALNGSALQRVGGFDPLFMMYGEDGELLQRACNDGFEIALLPHARHFHRHSLGSEGSTPGGNIIQRWCRRGIIITLLKDESRTTRQALTSAMTFVRRSYVRSIRHLRVRDLFEFVSSDLSLLLTLPRILRHRKRERLIQAIEQQAVKDIAPSILRTEVPCRDNNRVSAIAH